MESENADLSSPLRHNGPAELQFLPACRKTGHANLALDRRHPGRDNPKPTLAHHLAAEAVFGMECASRLDGAYALPALFPAV